MLSTELLELAGYDFRLDGQAPSTINGYSYGFGSGSVDAFERSPHVARPSSAINVHLRENDSVNINDGHCRLEQLFLDHREIHGFGEDI